MDKYSFNLYITGDSLSSKEIISNINNTFENHFNDNFTVYVIDVLHEPELAKKHKIFVTPTLVKLSPKPVKSVIGDFSSQEKVLCALNTLIENKNK